jgi:hypothetical protein
MGLVHESNLHTANSNYTAVVLTTSENMFIIVKELLRHTKCTVMAQTASVETALQYLYTGGANFLIIDDGNESPSTAAVREITSDPIGLLTPMLVLLMDRNANETIHESHLGRIKVARKPMTPSAFPPSYSKLVNLWSAPELQEIREKTRESLNTTLSERVEILQTLLKYPEYACFVARAIALTYHRMGKIKEAEGTLLEQMKKNSHDIGLLTTLGHVYLTSAMPSIANRIFTKIHSKFNESTLAIPDLIQSHILLEEYEKTTELFRILIKKDYMPTHMARYLSRILYARGYQKEASYVLANQPNLYRQLENQWKEILLDPLEKVG